MNLMGQSNPMDLHSKFFSSLTIPWKSLQNWKGSPQLLLETHIIWGSDVSALFCHFFIRALTNLQSGFYLVWALNDAQSAVCQRPVVPREPVAVHLGSVYIYSKTSANAFMFFLLMSLFQLGQQLPLSQDVIGWKGKRRADLVLYLVYIKRGNVYKMLSKWWYIQKRFRTHGKILRGPFYSLWVFGYVQPHHWLESWQWRWEYLLMDFPSLLLYWYRVHQLVPKTKQTKPTSATGAARRDQCSG